MKARWSYVIFMLLVVASCKTREGMQPISQRPISSLPKMGETNFRGNLKKGPEIFVRKKSITINPVEIEQETGSLYRFDDERNNLVAFQNQIVVGQTVPVDIKSTRLDADQSGSEGGKKDSKKKADNTSKEQADGGGEEEKILSSLPDLEPADKSNKLLKSLRMTITKQFPNGDALAMYQRRSTNGPDGSEIRLQARLPYRKLALGEGITTDDLTEISWTESADGELTERSSSSWDDEYTMRLSGFNEAKSKQAAELEDKRQQIAKAKEDLTNRLKSIGTERKQMAKEREDLLKRRKQDETKVLELEQKLKEQEDKVKEQEAKIQELAPKDEGKTDQLAQDKAAKSTKTVAKGNSNASKEKTIR